MKICYLVVGTKDKEFMEHASDYQLDMLYHGLSKTDHDVCVADDWTHMKTKDPNNLKKIWGKGFTVYGIMDDKFEIMSSMSDYDLCIVGLHHTARSRMNDNSIISTIQQIKNTVGATKYAIIDGWDRPEMPKVDFGDDVIYFKRELYSDYEDYAKPVSFAFPEEKIITPTLDNFFKKRDVAPLIPVNQSIDPSYMSTYIYEDEQSYYNMYQTSVYGLTSKKGGWDTLRHYEIIANRCIPWFVDLENCPPKTLWNFPKDLCFKARHFIKPFSKQNSVDYNNDCYPLPHCGVLDINQPGKINNPTEDRLAKIFEIQKELFRYLKNNLLTQHLAEYVINESFSK